LIHPDSLNLLLPNLERVYKVCHDSSLEKNQEQCHVDYFIMAKGFIAIVSLEGKRIVPFFQRDRPLFSKGQAPFFKGTGPFFALFLGNCKEKEIMLIFPP